MWKVNKGIFKFFDRTKELNSIPTKITFYGLQQSKNETYFDEDLHIFILYEKSFAASIGHFIEVYSTRTRDNREFWLLDIDHWTVNIPLNHSQSQMANTLIDHQLKDQIKSDLRDLTLDLDDDLYLFSGNVNSLWYMNYTLIISPK